MGQPFGIPQVAETGGNRRQMHRKQDARCIELGDQFLDSSRMMSYARVVIFCSWYAVPEQVGPVARYIYMLRQKQNRAVKQLHLSMDVPILVDLCLLESFGLVHVV